MESNALRERGNALEETYFRQLEARRNQRQRVEERRAALSRELGIGHPALLDALHVLGVTADTAPAFEALPLVEVAWADGAVAADERWRVLEIATRLGVELGSPAHAQLELWLTHRPSRDLLDAWYERVALLRPQEGHEARASLLLQGAREVAAAAGGVFGFGAVSSAERAVLDRLDDALDDVFEPVAAGGRS